MKKNHLFEFIRNSKNSPEGYEVIKKEHFILVEPNNNAREKPHIRIDKEFDNSRYFCAKVHYTQVLPGGVTVRVYFTNYGQIRAIKASKNDSYVDIDPSLSREIKTLSLKHYSKAIGYYNLLLESQENIVKNKIATSSCSEFAKEIEQLIKFNPTSSNLYKMWININENINKVPEPIAIANTPDNSQITVEKPIDTIIEEKSEPKESKNDPKIEIIANLRKAINDNLAKKEWGNLVVNLDLLLVYGQKIEEFHKKVNEEFAKFDLQVIREMYDITEPDIDYSCFENLFVFLFETDDKARESKLLAIVDFLHNHSRKFSFFMTEFDDRMQKHNKFFRRVRANKFKETMAIDIYQKLFKTRKKFAEIKSARIDFAGKNKFLASSLQAILKDEDLSSLPVCRESIKHIKGTESYYIFLEIKSCQDIEYNYLILAAICGKANLFKALINCGCDLTYGSLDKTSNALGTCVMAFSLLQGDRDEELSQYLHMLLEQGCNPKFITPGDEKKAEQIQLHSAPFRSKLGENIVLQGNSVSALGFINRKPYSLKVFLTSYNEPHLLVVHFSNISSLNGIVRRIDVSSFFNEVIFDVNIDGLVSSKQVFSGISMNLKIMFSSQESNKNLLLCIDLMLDRLYELIASLNELECIGYRSLIEHDGNITPELKFLSLSYYNILLYSLGKISENDYKIQVRKIMKNSSNDYISRLNQGCIAAKRKSTLIKVNYQQSMLTYYKPSFETILAMHTYCMVAYNDKHLLVMSFGCNANKNQLSFYVNKLAESKIYIYHSKKVEDLGNHEDLKKKFSSAIFKSCEYKIAEAKFSFKNKELSVSFLTWSDLIKLYNKYDEQRVALYSQYYYYESSLFPGSGEPFVYGAKDKDKLLDLVQKNDAEGVKVFFRNAFVKPHDAFILCCQKFKRLAVVKSLGNKINEKYSQAEANKSFSIFKTLLFHGGNDFIRFCYTGEDAREVALKIVNMFCNRPITSFDHKFLEEEAANMCIFPKGSIRMLGQLLKELLKQIREKKYTLTNVLFHIVDKTLLTSIVGHENVLQGIQAAEIAQITEVMGDGDCVHNLLHNSKIKELEYSMAAFARGQEDHVELKDPDMFGYVQALDILGRIWSGEKMNIKWQQK